MILMSCIFLVVLVCCQSSQFLVTISRIGGFLGLCVVMRSPADSPSGQIERDREEHQWIHCSTSGSKPYGLTPSC